MNKTPEFMNFGRSHGDRLPPRRPVGINVSFLGASMSPGASDLDGLASLLADCAGGPDSLYLLGPGCSAGVAPIASDSPFVERVAEAAKAAGVAILLRYGEVCGGRTYASTMLIDGFGNCLANYRCSHLDEHSQTEGRSAGQWLTIASWQGLRVGLMACQDLWHPEVARALALAGADLLVSFGSDVDDHSTSVVLCRARAIENRLAVVGFHSGGLGFDPEGGELGGSRTISIAFGDSADRGPPKAARRPRLYHGVVAEEVAKAPW